MRCHAAIGLLFGLSFFGRRETKTWYWNVDADNIVLKCVYFQRRMNQVGEKHSREFLMQSNASPGARPNMTWKWAEAELNVKFMLLTWKRFEFNSYFLSTVLDRIVFSFVLSFFLRTITSGKTRYYSKIARHSIIASACVRVWACLLFPMGGVRCVHILHIMYMHCYTCT